MINYVNSGSKPLKLSVLFVLSVAALSVKSQEKVVDTTFKTNKSSISVSVQPFFLLINAAKADLEFQPNGRRFGYVLTPEFYTGPIQDDDNFGYLTRLANDQLKGFGLGILQKYKFKDQLSSPYVAYGITYRHQELSIQTNGFYTTEQDGLMYYEYGAIKKRFLIDALLLSATIGYQKIAHYVVYDFYFGVGYKTPLGDIDFEGYRKYNQSTTSIAYKGVGMLVGLKLGYQFQ
jgi:hypothetical protein